MSTVPCKKANCLLLAVRGNYYYSEELGRFIQIDALEYERIIDFPYRGSFTTAFKKHLDWCESKRKGTTVSLSEALA